MNVKVKLSLTEPAIAAMEALGTCYEHGTSQAFYRSLFVVQSLLERLPRYEPAIHTSDFMEGRVRYLPDMQRFHKELLQAEPVSHDWGEQEISLEGKLALDEIARRIGAQSHGEAASFALCYMRRIQHEMNVRRHQNPRLVSVREFNNRRTDMFNFNTGLERGFWKDMTRKWKIAHSRRKQRAAEQSKPSKPKSVPKGSLKR